MLKIKRLKLLILIKPFWKDFAKHKAKYDFIKSLEDVFDVYYWYENGEINNIIKKLKITPDFIFHYDIAYNYKLSPRITGLNNITIPKGCYVIDSHYQQTFRKEYILKNKIDIVFSVTKENFLIGYPEFASRFAWLPWSINTGVFKDWNLQKKYDYLLMGLVHPVAEGNYPFRKKVLETFRHNPNFKHHAHPGHLVNWTSNPLVDIKYSKEINKAKIFFTCGSTLNYPVMKFFEVPACNTLLLAESNNDIFELGFRDKVNFISCKSNDVKEKAEFYLKNKKIRNQISKNGYNFIRKRHSNITRAIQFLDYVNHFLITKQIKRIYF
jgi:Glycosyl transferases group 1